MLWEHVVRVQISALRPERKEKVRFGYYQSKNMKIKLHILYMNSKGATQQGGFTLGEILDFVM